jgi:hypothetical protein
LCCGATELISPLEAGMASTDVPFDQTTTEPAVKADKLKLDDVLKR